MPTRFSHLQGHHLLSVISLAWVGILLAAGLHSPSAFWVTVALLVVNAFVCVVTLVRHKRILVVLNLVQIVLFAVLHYQVFRVWGQHHYEYDSEPGFLDWLQFTAAHVLRAVDLLDVLEAYGISLQNVRHHSTLSGILLLAMHLTVDIFLLALAIRWGLRLWQRFVGSRRAAPALRRRPGKGLLVCLLLVLFCAASQRWRDPDWLLWPLDNVVRTADVGDAMQLFHWRLHGVEMGFWTASLAVLLRLLAGLYLAGWLSYAHVKLLGHRALRTLDDFVGDLSHKDAAVRQTTAEALGKLGPGAAAAVPALVLALADEAEPVRRAAAAALAQVDPDWRQSDGARAAVPGLVRALADRDEVVRGEAAAVLEAVDPDWRHSAATQAVLPDLVRALADPDEAVQGAAREALEMLDPQWRQSAATQSVLPQLVRALANEAGTLHWRPMDALDKIGPAAVPHLMRALTENNEELRRKAVLTLGILGPPARAALPALVHALADPDAAVRRAAANVLCLVGELAELPPLAQALVDSDRGVL